jgi:thiol:disulfide interchange protein
MRTGILIAVVGAAILIGAGFQPTTPAAPAAVYSVDEYDPARDAAADLAETSKLAKETGKRILLDVGGNWCGWCRALDRFITGTPSVAAALHDGYIIMKVNMSEENRNEAFLGRFPKIKGYPHIFVLDSDGAFLHSQDTGPLEEGKSYNEKRFLEFLNQWAPKTPQAAAR